MGIIDHELEKAVGVALAVVLRQGPESQIKHVAQRCGSLGVEPVTMLEECVLLDVLIAIASTKPDGKDIRGPSQECWERIGNHAERYWRRQRK